MKKFILVPLMVLPLLTGCGLKQPEFSLEEWLTNIEDGTMTFFDMKNIVDESTGAEMPTNGYSDYQYKLAEIIKENATSKSRRTFVRDRGTPYVRYIIRREMGNFFEIQVIVTEDTLTMYTSGYNSKRDYITEDIGYAIPKAAGKKIIEETVNRWKEMQDLADETHEKVYYETTPETFFSYIENNETKPLVKFNDKKARDTDLTLLNELKDIVYIEVDDFLTISVNESGIVYYGYEKDYTIAVGKDYYKKPLAQLTKYYFNPALNWGIDELSECRVTYSISEESYNKFMDAYRAM